MSVPDNPTTKSRQRFPYGCVIVLIVFFGAVILIPVWIVQSDNREEAVKEKQRTAESQLRQDRKNQFAAGYMATWPDLISGDGGQILLAVDFQRRLLAGSPVAFEIESADVRSEGGHLVLVGEVRYSQFPLKVELITDQNGLDVIRGHRFFLWVAARLDAVTPRHEHWTDPDGDDGSSQEIVYYATGKALEGVNEHGQHGGEAKKKS